MVVSAGLPSFACQQQRMTHHPGRRKDVEHGEDVDEQRGHDGEHVGLLVVAEAPEVVGGERQLDGQQRAVWRGSEQRRQLHLPKGAEKQGGRQGRTDPGCDHDAALGWREGGRKARASERASRGVRERTGCWSAQRLSAEKASARGKATRTEFEHAASREVVACECLRRGEERKTGERDGKKGLSCRRQRQPLRR